MKERDLVSLEKVKIFNDSKENKKHQNAQAKQIIRLFNAETSQLINNVNGKTLKVCRTKYLKVMKE